MRRRSLYMTPAMGKFLRSRGFACVYVIGKEGGEPPVKVGFARDPRRRFTEIQTELRGQRLELYGVFWFFTRDIARQVVECGVLSRATIDGSGWLNASPAEAAAMIRETPYPALSHAELLQRMALGTEINTRNPLDIRPPPVNLWH